MNRVLIVFATACAALASTTASGAAQARVPQPLYDPAQLPLFHGIVQVFTFTPHGDVDGFVLVDGTEVKTPPHLSAEIVRVVAPGNSVSVHGLKAASLPLIQALSVRNDTSGQEVVDNGPPAPGRVPPQQAAEQEPAAATLQGRIRLLLHGPRGDVNGALLDDGTILKLPPPEADRLADLIVPGHLVAAQGVRHAFSSGSFVELTAIGPVNGPMRSVAGGSRSRLNGPGAQPG